MAGLRLDTSAMLAAALHRSSDPKAWACGIVQQLPETWERERVLSASLAVCSAHAYSQRLHEVALQINEEVASHWVAQPEVEAQRAVQLIG